MTFWNSLLDIFKIKAKTKHVRINQNLNSKSKMEPLSPQEFSAISTALSKACDVCDTDLQEAISYSLRLYEDEKNKYFHGPDVRQTRPETHELQPKKHNLTANSQNR